MSLQIMKTEAENQIPSATYAAKVLEVIPCPSNYPDKAGIQFTFELYSADPKINLQKRICKIWVRSKDGKPAIASGDLLDKWLQAFNKNLALGETIDIEGLKGQNVFVTLTNITKESKDGGADKRYVNLTNLAPYAAIPQMGGISINPVAPSTPAPLGNVVNPASTSAPVPGSLLPF